MLLLTLMEYNQSLVQHARVESLKGNVGMISERRITGDGIASLYYSSRALAQDVMGFDSITSTIFAMRFGTVMLTSATFKDEAEIHHADGNVTNIPLNTPSEMGRSVSRYLSANFNPNAERASQHQVFRELEDRFRSAGIPSGYIGTISNAAENMAIEVGQDRSRLSPKYFTEAAGRFPKRPSFVLNEQTYPEFIDQTGQWLHDRFEAILDNIVTGKYLNEQEMS